MPVILHPHPRQSNYGISSALNKRKNPTSKCFSRQRRRILPNTVGQYDTGTMLAVN